VEQLVQTRVWQALVVEDEVPLAGIFARALQFAGFRTSELYDGQEALNFLKETKEVPSLVIIDYHLPQVSGKELLQFIRADERYRDTRVIIATSDSAVASSEMDGQSDLVLLKPISYSQLRDLASRLR
jgi:DNA-binding response OmpR family regulator